MTLQNLSHKVWARTLALSLAVSVPGCSFLSSLTGRSVNIPTSVTSNVGASGIGGGNFAAVNNATATLRSGNVSAMTSTAVNLGVPAALVLGRVAVKAIQGAIARRAEERARQQQATQLFYAGVCKLDVQPGPVVNTQDAAGFESQAEVAFSQGDYAKADAALQKAVAKRQAEKGGEAALGRVLNRQAALYLATAQFDKAEPPAQKSLEVREKALGKDSPEVAETLSTQGAIWQEKSDFAKAEAALQRALQIREKALKEDHICVATTVNQMGGLYKELGAYNKAEPLYQRALTIRTAKIGEGSLEVAQSQSDLGGLYLAMGNYAGAEPFYQKALDVRKSKLGDDHPDVAETLNEMGNLEKRRGAYPRAEGRYREALAIREKKLQPSDPRIAETLGDLAALYETLGDLKAAEAPLKRSLELRQKALGNDSPEAAESLGQLALLEQSRGNYDAADGLLKQALQIREKKLGKEHPAVAESCVALGDLAFARRDLAGSAQYYDRAFNVRKKALGAEHPLVADCLERQARLARARGDLAKAEPLYTQAVALREKSLGNQHPDYAQTLVGLAAVQVGKGAVDEGLKNLGKALEIYEITLHNLSGTSDESRVDSFLRTVRAQEDMIYSLLTEKSPSEATITLAAKTALLRKGRSVDEAADTSRALFEGLSAEERQKLATLRATRTQRADLALSGSGAFPPDIYQQRLKDAQEAEEKLARELLTSSPTLRQRLSQNSAQQVLEEVQKTLPNDAALLEILAFRQFDFHPTEKNPAVAPGALHYAALIVLPEGKVQAFDLGPGEAIDGAIGELLAALTNSESDWQPAAKKVGDLVLKPIASATADRARLYVAPDGQLNLVPFAVLPGEKGMLIDHIELTYLTSGRDFLRKPGPTNQAPRSSVALLADPQFATQVKESDIAPPGGARGLFRGLRLGKVAPLPGTREEVKAIEKLLKKAEVHAYYGSEATKKEFLTLERPGILHVATHGLFLGEVTKGGNDARGLTLEDDDATKPPQAARPAQASQTAAGAPRMVFLENPLLSSMLVLAGAESASKIIPEKRDPAIGNGLVTALEIGSMNLWGTQLVVLSACETGRGDVSSLGQGVYGLRRAVMVAGAETLLTSLWKVDDKATRDLMTTYYKNLLKGNGRGQAMREAALSLRKKKAHPYFWAPFIAIGRSAPIVGIGKGKKAAAAAEEKDEGGDE